MYVEVGNLPQISRGTGEFQKYVEPNDTQLKEYTHIFSIQDASDKNLKVRRDVKYGKHQIIKFDDVQENSVWGTAPGRRDVQDIIGFARTLDDDSVLYIHCFAGISRSPAAALGILVTRSLDKYGQIQTGFDEWKAIRRSKLFWPSALIVKLFDEELQLDGKLIKLVEDWRQVDSEYGIFH